MQENWKKWSGEECPIDGIDVAQIVFRNGAKSHYCAATERLKENWKHCNSPHDIVLYRIVKADLDQEWAVDLLAELFSKTKNLLPNPHCGISKRIELFFQALS